MSIEKETKFLQSRLLKAGEASIEPAYPVSRLMRAVTQGAEEQRREAEDLVARARTEAAGIIAEAERRARELHESARAEGLRSGAESLIGLTDGVAGALDALRARWSADVGRIACEVAATIVDVEFVVRPERVCELVERALDSSDAYRWVIVFLHPDDLAIVERSLKNLSTNAPEGHRLEFRKDVTLARGSLRLETNMGTLETSLADRLAALRGEARDGSLQ